MSIDNDLEKLKAKMKKLKEKEKELILKKEIEQKKLVTEIGTMFGELLHISTKEEADNWIKMLSANKEIMENVSGEIASSKEETPTDGSNNEIV